MKSAKCPNWNTSRLGVHSSKRACPKRGTRTHVQMISDDGHHTSARTVCVVQVVPMADSRTERL